MGAKIASKRIENSSFSAILISSCIGLFGFPLVFLNVFVGLFGFLLVFFSFLTGCGMWDRWDVGCGMWDVGFVVRRG